MLKQIKNLVVAEEGQGMAEYGLILAGVAIVAIVGIKLLGTEISALIGKVTAQLKTTP
ncbi:Flp family type IVb pilin [Gottfriedia sp. S16(2024)]|uniref:Flp family type IVb pilin n=1 Tax=Gottfriedia sp. S16(2024) TaxID=3162883 RepID=UPI003D19C0A0